MPQELLAYSLLLIAAMDVVLMIAHLIVLDSVSRLGRINRNTRIFCQGREDCRRLLIIWLTMLCFVQIVLLCIGFSIIARDIFVLYGYIANTEDLASIGNSWSRVTTALGIMSLFVVVILMLAVMHIFDYEPRPLWTAWGSLRFRRPQKRYFITGHAFLNLSAVMCVLMSCSHACYGTDVVKIIKLELVMAFFALFFFAAGTATWIFAVWNWQLRSLRNRAEFRSASA